MNLATPREPAARARTVAERFPTTQQTRRVTRWSHIVAAAASSPSSRHALNEDSHSPLDGTAPIFVGSDRPSSNGFSTVITSTAPPHSLQDRGSSSIDTNLHKLRA